LRAAVGYARALLADDETAEHFYRAAIETDLANWPCYRGRMLLWYGRWLRRQRRVTESRAPLRAALEGFDALAFPALSDIARLELRSTGETPSKRKPETWTQLSPQELQIAQLAAEGQTNREIAQKLFLSHRTVEYHLHRIFPKLGITRRSHLRESISGALVTSEG
jgi:DNA-binding CsgD family transcriptional regulator